STDSNRISNETVSETHASWGSSIPVLRDSDHDAYHQLGVSATPTLILLGQEGTVQMVHLGMIPTAEMLEEKLAQLVGGTDLVEQERQAIDERMEEYQQLLDEVTIKTRSP